jgi:hypothetical protein
MADRIRVHMLADGRVKVITDGVSAENHRAADKLLDLLKQEIGGGVAETERRTDHGILTQEHAHGTHTHTH